MPGENEEKVMSGNQPEVQYAAFLAIDWADEKHVWSLEEAHSSKRERGEVGHMPEDIETWVAGMSQRFAGRPIAVAVEQSRGALVFLLSKEVPTAELSRVGRPFHPSIAMGARLLRAAVSPGQEAPCGGAGVSLQMDSHNPSLLEGTGGVRRESLPGGLGQAQLAAVAATKTAAL
jgi:hypothetical protein